MILLEFVLEHWPLTRRSHVARVLVAMAIGLAGYTAFDLLLIVSGNAEWAELAYSGPIGAIVLPTAAFAVGLVFYRERGRFAAERPAPPRVKHEPG